MRITLLIAGLLMALAPAAEAGIKAGPNMAGPGHHRLRATTGPVDSIGSALGVGYSLRKVKSTYSGPAVRLRRASDALEADIPFVGFTGFTGAPLDTVAANAHCAATNCTVHTLYDQSGNGRDAVMAVASQQPAYVGDCGNGLPCIRLTAADQYPRSASVAWTSGKATLSVVAKRQTSSAGACYWSVRGVEYLQSYTAVNTWAVTDSAGIRTGAAADAAWHSAIGAIDGAASLLRIDDVESTGVTITGSAAAGSAGFGPGVAGTVCDLTEVLTWDNYTLTLAERVALTANRRGFWGF